MLNVTDLMIGDLVFNKFNNKIERVQAILEDQVMLDYNDFYIPDDIDPIDITKDILEKIGFHCSEEDMSWELNFEQDIVGGIGGSELKIMRFYLGDKTSLFTITSCVDGRCSVFIDKVHQLQHVFKMYNVRKEIIL